MDLSKIAEEQKKEGPTDDQLKNIVGLARQMKIKELEIDAQEKILNQMKAEHRALQQVDIPTAMQEAGVTEFTFAGRRGQSVKIAIAENFYMSIPVKNKTACARWLKKQKLGDLVALLVGVKFAKGEDKKAQKFYLSLVKRKMTPTLTESMHTGAVKGALKELLKGDTDVPFDLFGLRIVMEAKVK